MYKHIGDKILEVCRLNEISLYELPNLDAHLRTYEADLVDKRTELEGVMELSGGELTRVLRENISGDGDTLKHHLTKILYLERIVDIICHSKQVGEPANHVMLTMHVPID